MSDESDVQKVLYKLIEDGMSASSDALAQVSNTAWTTLKISTNTDTPEIISARLAQDTSAHYGAFAQAPGALFLLMFSRSSGPALAAAFMRDRKQRPGIVPLREDIYITEIANIVINAFANKLADACDTALILTSPEITVAKKSELFKLSIEKLKMSKEQHAIMSYVHMSSHTLSSDCTVILFISQQRRDSMLLALDR